MNALSLPMAFGMDLRRRDTVMLPPALYARAHDAAKRQGWSFLRFAEHAFERFFRSIELSTDNLEFAEDITRTVGPPWTIEHVVNRLLDDVRAQVRAGKLRPAFWAGQLRSLMKG